LSRVTALRPRPAVTWQAVCLVLCCLGALALGGRATAASGALLPPSSPGDGEPVAIVLVRHAEKGIGGENDPRLTAAGMQRARALADLLSRETVTHLFATEYRRTRDTLVPLAEKAGVEITVVPAREPQRLLEKLASLPAGSLAVVAGHSNTIPDLVEALATPAAHEEPAPAVEPIREDEHNRLYIVIRPALPSPPGDGGSPASGTGPSSMGVRVLRLSYGAGSP